MLLALAILLLILAIGLGAFVKGFLFLIAVLALLAFAAYFMGSRGSGRRAV
jgi:hypothetical protein